MKVLVVNCWSSSLKYQIIDMENDSVLAKGNFERIGEQESFLTHKVNGDKHVIKTPVMNHEEALKIILTQLVHEEYGVLKDLAEISAVVTTRARFAPAIAFLKPCSIPAGQSIKI